jgi:hypothetical protein
VILPLNEISGIEPDTISAAECVPNEHLDQVIINSEDTGSSVSLHEPVEDRKF